MRRADLAEHQVDRALVDLDFLAVDEQRVERFGQVAADRPAVPIVLGRHGPRQPADRLRQRRPDEDHVEVAGVIGEVDALAGVRLAVDPAHARPAEEAGTDSEQHLGDHKGKPPGRPATPGRHAASKRCRAYLLWAASTPGARP